MDRIRHRDRLLSLKYSTPSRHVQRADADLTLPNLRSCWRSRSKGWDGRRALSRYGCSAALCNCLQPLLLAGPLTQILQLSVAAPDPSPWRIAVAPYPDVPVHRGVKDALFTVMLILATLANSVASVTWSSAISEWFPNASPAAISPGGT